MATLDAKQKDLKGKALGFGNNGLHGLQSAVSAFWSDCFVSHLICDFSQLPFSVKMQCPGSIIVLFSFLANWI